MLNNVRNLSTKFQEETFDALATQNGRHYVVAPDGRLLKLSTSASVFALRNDDNNSGEKQSAKESLRTTKIIFPNSSALSIKRFLSDTGRYVQRSNNTSMSIRDFVEAKGRSDHIQKCTNPARSTDIRAWG